MQIAILGGGALGLMWSARLLQAGMKPIIIVRTAEQKQLLLSQGLIYTEGGSSLVLHPIVYSIDEFEGQLPQWTLMTVKQTQIDSLLPFIRQKLPRSGTLICLQNGMGQHEKLTQALSIEQILLASTSDGALRHAGNHVERTGYGRTYIGQVGAEQQSNEVKEFITWIERSGFDLHWDSQILARLWRKCIINCTINPLTALLEIQNGQLLQSSHALRMMRYIYDEACLVAKSQSFQFFEDLWQEIEAVCRNTSRNRSSMLQDLLAKRATEIDTINGYIVRAGEQSRIPTPYNHMMVQLIHTKEEL